MFKVDREKTHVKRENFINVQGWMIIDLDLKGNELLIYACIYGLTQTENQWFTGSRQYLADWTNSTKQGVQKCLNSLVEKGFLDKREKFHNGVKFCEYRATDLTTSQQSFSGVVNKVDGDSQQSLLGVGNKVSRGGKQSCPNNIDNNIENITRKKDRDIKQSLAEPITRFEDFWKAYPKQTHRFLAEQEYVQSVCRGNEEEWLVEAAKEYALCVQGKDMKYVKNPENWLRENLYLDYPQGTYEKQKEREAERKRQEEIIKPTMNFGYQQQKQEEKTKQTKQDYSHLITTWDDEDLEE